MCPCCTAARDWPGTTAASTYSPSCKYCGARLIKAIGKFKRPREEIADRRRAVLADWIAHGHNEDELRALAKTEMPIEPKK